MNNTSEAAPRLTWPARAACFLFYLIAATWTVLALITLARLGGGSQERMIGMGIVVVLMLGNAGVLALIGWWIGRRERLFFWLGLAVLALNIVLSVTDQFGVIDLATMLVDAGLFALLLLKRKHFYD